MGRLATKIAGLLMGKGKAGYSTHMDCGDWVVVTNIKDIVLTGRKSQQKLYRSHSGYPGGFKEVPFARAFEKDPTFVVKKAVDGMLPDNRLKKVRLSRLKLFAAQQEKYKNDKNK